MPRERRWTILVIPHSTEPVRGWVVTDRLLRLVRRGGAAIVALVGFAAGALFWSARTTEKAVALAGGPSEREIDSLRLHLDSLTSRLGQIRAHEASIAGFVGAEPESTSAWTERLTRAAGSDFSPASFDLLSILRDSLRREVARVNHVADSLSERASEVTLKAQRIADSLGTSDRRAPMPREQPERD